MSNHEHGGAYFPPRSRPAIVGDLVCVTNAHGEDGRVPVTVDHRESDYGIITAVQEAQEPLDNGWDLLIVRIVTHEGEPIPQAEWYDRVTPRSNVSRVPVTALQDAAERILFDEPPTAAPAPGALVSARAHDGGRDLIRPEEHGIIREVLPNLGGGPGFYGAVVILVTVGGKEAPREEWRAVEFVASSIKLRDQTEAEASGDYGQAALELATSCRDAGRMA